MIDLYRHRHLLLTAYIVVLLGATLAPLPGSSYGPSGFDKLVHVGLFGGLAFLVYYYESEPTLRGAVRSFVLASGAAMMIEVLQAVLPFRNADLKDFIAGLLGAAFGVAGAAVLRGALSRWGRSADSTKG